MQKKGIFILLLLIIGICAISTSNAADDVDIVSSEDSNLEELTWKISSWKNQAKGKI